MSNRRRRRGTRIPRPFHPTPLTSSAPTFVPVLSRTQTYRKREWGYLPCDVPGWPQVRLGTRLVSPGSSSLPPSSVRGSEWRYLDSYHYTPCNRNTRGQQRFVTRCPTPKRSVLNRSLSFRRYYYVSEDQTPSPTSWWRDLRPHSTDLTSPSETLISLYPTPSSSTSVSSDSYRSYRNGYKLHRTSRKVGVILSLTTIPVKPLLVCRHSNRFWIPSPLENFGGMSSQRGKPGSCIRTRAAGLNLHPFRPVAPQLSTNVPMDNRNTGLLSPLKYTPDSYSSLRR